jgi:hypothetical protein
LRHERLRRTLHFNWNSLLLEITYDPIWLAAQIAGEDLAHMEVHLPDRRSAPVCETRLLQLHHSGFDRRSRLTVILQHRWNARHPVRGDKENSSMTE